MFEVYLNEEMVFEGNYDEMNTYCKNNEFDYVLDKAAIELENMILGGYTWDSFDDCHHYL